MFRKKTAKVSRNTIRWRSHEPTRLETFSDAVFAFAVTLIIVSLEVPKTFDELFETMKGFVAFGACFTILFLIWNSQNIFFRRYGLTDSWTTTLNGFLLFIVLTYTYPLKFLAAVVFSSNTYTDHGQKFAMIQDMDVPSLMYVYDAGFILIYLLFFLMYKHARSQAAKLELTPYEIFETSTQLYANLVSVGIGLAAVLVTFVLPIAYKGMSGYVYFAMTFAYPILFTIRGKKAKKLFGEITG